MKHCNQGATPLQRSGGAAPECSGLGAQPQYATALGSAGLQSARNPGDAASPTRGAAPPSIFGASKGQRPPRYLELCCPPYVDGDGDYEKVIPQKGRVVFTSITHGSNGVIVCFDRLVLVSIYQKAITGKKASRKKSIQSYHGT